MTDPLLLAAASAHLVSFLKPLLIFVTFVPWAWLVSTHLDKDAAKHHLNRHLFNAVHLGTGVAALLAMLFIPIFWIGWPLGIILLATPIYVYWQIRNREVPEHQQFHLTALDLRERLTARKKIKAAVAAVRFVDKDGNERQTPPKDDPRFAMHMLAEDVLVPALEARATEFSIAVSSRGVVMTQTIDGVRYKRDTVPAESGMPLIDYFKDVAGLNVEDRRRHQKADFKVSSPLGDTELTVETAGSSAGQELRIVFNLGKRLRKPFDDLGLLPQQLERLRVFEEVHERHGVVLIAAPPGNGLTTTAYALVSRHDAYTCNIKTLEREIRTTIDGVDHLLWDRNNPDIDYATALQSIIRRDPDVVLISELRDKETARVAAEPGLDGPLLYVPIRAASLTDAVRSWAKLVGDLKLAAGTLRCVMNQRLLRNVCPNCRQGYEPTPDLLKRMNLPAKKVEQLYRHSGKVQVKNKVDTCPVCGGTGYFGQSGAFEVLMIGDEERRLLLAGDLKGTLAAARRNKMVYLQEAALHKALKGDTSVEEVIRVTVARKDKGEDATRREEAKEPISPNS